jgi:hypothetical protein
MLARRRIGFSVVRIRSLLRAMGAARGCGCASNGSGVDRYLWLAAVAYRRRWRTVVDGFALLALSLIIDPTWTAGWLSHLHHQPTRPMAPVFWPLGFVGLIGLLRRRQLGGRALAVMTLIPVAGPAIRPSAVVVRPDAMPRRRRVDRRVVGWIHCRSCNYPTRFPQVMQLIVVVSTYLPAAVIAWSQPNVGDAPAWMERVIAGWPPWARGRPGSA